MESSPLPDRRPARRWARRRPARVGHVFVVAAVLAVVATVTGPGPAALAAATCADIEVVTARGTGEPGTLGLFVGDPVFAALKSAITTKSLNAYAVNYPASLIQPSSVQAGNRDVVAHVTAQAAACPNQRFILVGYSQGANVIDNSIGISSDGALVGGPIVATIPASLSPRVVAVLLFGNPIRAQGRTVTGEYAARTDDYCATGDPVCQAGGADVMAHLGYGSTSAQPAAAFAAARV